MPRRKRLYTKSNTTDLEEFLKALRYFLCGSRVMRRISLGLANAM
jgi:hypothetical protein